MASYYSAQVSRILDGSFIVVYPEVQCIFEVETIPFLEGLGHLQWMPIREDGCGL
jgi:hypothetical protein